MSKLQVGQTLWWVYSDRRSGGSREVTVVKVGRKWAELSNRHRIDLESWRADGGQYCSPGCCYERQKAYEDAVTLATDWANLRYAIDGMRSRPDCVTHETIGKIRELLRLPAGEVK